MVGWSLSLVQGGHVNLLGCIEDATQTLKQRCQVWVLFKVHRQGPITSYHSRIHLPPWWKVHCLQGGIAPMQGTAHHGLCPKLAAPLI